MLDQLKLEKTKEEERINELTSVINYIEHATSGDGCSRCWETCGDELEDIARRRVLHLLKEYREQLKREQLLK